MKLNPDCVRDVMICLETEATIEFERGSYTFSGPSCNKLHESEKLSCYDYTDIAYSLLQLAESGYICMDYTIHIHSLEISRILYITPKGHDFIARIYDEKTWKDKLKPILGKFGSVSLSVVEAISEGVAGALIDRTISQNLHTP